jgi:hypothetical protein
VNSWSDWLTPAWPVGIAAFGLFLLLLPAGGRKRGKYRSVEPASWLSPGGCGLQLAAFALLGTGAWHWYHETWRWLHPRLPPDTEAWTRARTSEGGIAARFPVPWTETTSGVWRGQVARAGKYVLAGVFEAPGHVAALALPPAARLGEVAALFASPAAGVPFASGQLIRHDRIRTGELEGERVGWDLPGGLRLFLQDYATPARRQRAVLLAPVKYFSPENGTAARFFDSVQPAAPPAAPAPAFRFRDDRPPASSPAPRSSSDDPPARRFAPQPGTRTLRGE